MIEVKLGEMFANIEAIRRVLATKMPSKAAYRLSKIGTIIERELRDYENIRQKRIKELGVENENGESCVITDPEKVKMFLTEQQELLDEIIKIELDPVPLSLLGESVEIAPADLMVFKEIIIDNG